MEKIYGYLFVHFTSDVDDGEQIYFAISKDGLHWKDLNDSKIVLRSDIGQMGARDPFVIRDVRNGGYHIIATDLRIASGKGWEWAVTEASRDLLHWYSKDLVSWEGPESFTLAVPGAGCLWAPECIYDKKNDEFFIFFASNVDETGDGNRKQMIYSVRTKDFKEFTPTKKYIEKENHVIDTTIIEYNNKYFRFSKNETNKKIDLEVSDELEGKFTPVQSNILEEMAGVEGPEIFPLNDKGKFCLIVDRFASHKGYLPLISDDLESGNFRVLEDVEFDFGHNLKRHGGIMPLTEDEYQRLLHNW